MPAHCQHNTDRHTTTAWQVDSWQRYRAKQQPHYRNQAHLAAVLQELAQRPALLTCADVMHLRTQLRQVFAGRAFIVQGGDCAERFADCTPPIINARLQLMQQMAKLISAHADTQVLNIARMAGQYAKPRTHAFETIAGQRMHTFRGDNVNSFTPDPSMREPDPQRLARGYQCAATTLQHMRDSWSPAQGDLFTSHEGLLLAYEQALTATQGTHWYNHGAHLLWVGNRTARVRQAHVEYLRGISNAIGIKIGATAEPQELVEIVHQLNPANTCDRIVLIARFGCEQVQKLLPRFITALQRAARNVIWTVDPMHGNTIYTAQGIKTRHCQHIAAEVQHSFALHREHGSRLGGVHLELSSANVTECLGGRHSLQEEDLARAYHTACDPRLNYQQSLEVAKLVGKLLVEQAAKK